MNEAIENCLRKKQFRIEDAGDGMFFVLFYEPSPEEQSEIMKTAQKYYTDVQWCPDADSHAKEAEDVFAVLNCFYPARKERRE
jgi:hypothetical protein